MRCETRHCCCLKSAANLNFRQFAALDQQSKMRGVLPAHTKLCAPCPSTTQALLQRKALHRRCLTNPLTKQRGEVKVLPRSHARKNTCRSHKTAASITCAAATGKSVFRPATRCPAARSVHASMSHRLCWRIQLSNSWCYSQSSASKGTSSCLALSRFQIVYCC